MFTMSQEQDKVGQLTLRKQQQKFLEVIQANGSGTYLLNVPGGYGKTDAVLAAYMKLKERNEVDRFLYICWGTSRKDEFKEQLKSKLQRLEFSHSTKYLSVDVEGAVTIKESRENLYEFYLLNAELLVSRVSTIEMLTQTCRWFVVIDESHHCTEENEGGKAIQRLSYKYRVGLSATPSNLSGQSLINHTNTPVENIVYLDIRGAIKEEAIRPFRYKVANYDITLIDEIGVPRKLTTDEIREWERVADTVNSTKFGVQKGLRMSDKYISEIFSRALMYYNEWNLRQPGEHKILVFAPNVMSAEFCCNVINNSEGKGFADWIGSGFYGKPKEENQKIKTSFTDGDLQCLVSVNMAGEGYDAPRASIGIWLSFLYNSNMALQMCYRIMRRNYGIKDYVHDKCLMLVPSDSGAIELFEQLTEQCEIEFEQRPDSKEVEDDFEWPDMNVLIPEIIEAKGIELFISASLAFLSSSFLLYTSV